MDAIVKRWRGGTSININTILDTVLFADDQIRRRSTTGDTQPANDFHILIRQSIEKAFSGKDRVRNKIYINNKTLQKVNTFNYLGCMLSYEGDEDMPSKISKFVKKQLES
jgi:hypothetical protein